MYSDLEMPTTLAKPRVNVQVVRKSITSLVNMGATFSVLTSHSGPRVPFLVFVMGMDKTPSFKLKALLLPCVLER